MADFKTHLNVGAATGFAVSVVSYTTGWTSNALLSILLFFLTIAGSFLPDMDSDTGVAVKLIFGFYAYIAAAASIFLLDSWDYTLASSLFIAGIVFIAVRYGLSELFMRYTKHRGIFHSIPAFLISFLLTLSIIKQLKIAESEKFAIAFAVAAGYLSHLILDEIFAVNFISDTEGKIFLSKKKSFGSALDLGFGKNKYTGIVAWTIVLILFIFVYPSLKKIYFDFFG